MELEFEKEGERKRRKLDDEEEKPADQSSRLESLPREIILDILSGLPISSLVRFKSVCRAWRMLVRDPDLVNMHSTRMAEGNPCLIFHCDNPIRNQLYFVQLPACNDKIKEKVKMFDVPFWAAMSEFDVVGSCNGLLCLSDALYNDALYIYNPFSRKYQELPKSVQYLHQELVFGFGFHPTTMEYKVVKIIYYKNSDRCYRRTFRVTSMNSEVQIFTLGSSTWRSMGRAAHHLLQGPSQVLVNGRLHWVTWPRRYKRRSIISFDLAEDQFQEVPTPDCYTLNRRKYHLVVLGGCLAAAVYSNFGKLEIWVMRDYGVKDSWMKKFNIGSHVPRGFERNVSQSFKISKIISKGRFVRVLCLLQNGEILLEYKSRALVCYDPKSGKFKDLMFQGIPKWFQAVVHVGSLSWIDTFIDA